MRTKSYSRIIFKPKSACNNCWLKTGCTKNKNASTNNKQSVIKKTVGFKKGEHLIKNGDIITGLYCINRGVVKIYKNVKENKEFIFGFAGKGEIVGLNSFLINESVLFSAMAVSNVAACYISFSEMNLLLRQKPLIMERLVQNLCEKLDFMEGCIASNISNKRKKRITLP
ncbi:MAG: hypothetical protein POELPBGB_01113 [Bacteroidia bacterium]|nr:hypothetical protein [Bacteroidia bacterium]